MGGCEGGVARENSFCSFGRVAVLQDGRTGGCGGSVAEGAGAAGPRGGGGVAALSRGEERRRSVAQRYRGAGREAALSFDWWRRVAEWCEVFFCGRRGVFRSRRNLWRRLGRFFRQ